MSELEYGIIYNKNRKKGPFDDVEYLFCAYDTSDSIYAADPYNGRLVIVDKKSRESTYISRTDWVPRWIQIAPDMSIFYLDANKCLVGKIVNSTVVKEVWVSVSEPMFIKLGADNSILIGGKGDIPLIELDENWTVVHQLNISNLSLRSAEKIADDKILVCDDQHHQVYIIDWNGTKYWEYGVLDSPGCCEKHLFSPRYCTYHNGRYFIADGMNNRVICVDEQGKIFFDYHIDEYGNSLWMPSCIQTNGKSMIVTDAHNKRVIEVDLQTWSSHQWGDPIVKEFRLRGPRGLAISEDESYVFVADTLQNRLISLTKDFDEVNTSIGLTYNFFWPRAVCLANGLVYVADSRNKCIVIWDSRTQTIIKKVDSYILNGVKKQFLDVHDIRVYESTMLICDSLANMVLLINCSGECEWVYGENGDIKDPHSAIRDKNGNFFIADTGNNRVLIVNIHGEIIRSIAKIGNDSLAVPRWIEEIENSLLITDSGNNRIILIDCDDKIQGMYGGECGVDASQLRLPRCAKKWFEYLLISDTRNNRIIRVPWHKFIN